RFPNKEPSPRGLRPRCVMLKWRFRFSPSLQLFFRRRRKCLASFPVGGVKIQLLARTAREFQKFDYFLGEGQRRCFLATSNRGEGICLESAVDRSIPRPS